MRLSALTWPFPFLVRPGWATAGVPNPNPAQALGHAFLLRGNGAVFSRGFGRICAALRQLASGRKTSAVWATAGCAVTWSASTALGGCAARSS
jgi:hypothetical protein